MTKAKFFYENNLFSKLEISGHSGYAEFGSDIVCSGINLIIENLIEILEQIESSYPKNLKITIKK